MNTRLLITKLLIGLALAAGATRSHANPTDFTVHSVTTTNVFKLSEAKGKFVALHFLLKTECPYCIRHTHDYMQKSAKDTNVIHIFLKPDTDVEIKAWAGKLGAGSPAVSIYRDRNAELAKAFNVPDGYKFHGQTVHYPALVLLNEKGKEVFRYVGRSNADRLSHEQFTKQLELIRQSPP